MSVCVGRGGNRKRRERDSRIPWIPDLKGLFSLPTQEGKGLPRYLLTACDTHMAASSPLPSATSASATKPTAAESQFYKAFFFFSSVEMLSTSEQLSTSEFCVMN